MSGAVNGPAGGGQRIRLRRRIGVGAKSTPATIEGRSLDRSIFRSRSDVPTSVVAPTASPHQSVMRNEVVAFLAPKSGGMYIDLTAGAGGHLEAILDATSPGGTCIGIDRDREALTIARARLARFGSRVTLLHGNAQDVEDLVERATGTRHVPIDGIILDAGVSSMQLDRPERGFSFRQDGPLDMRMDQSEGRTAADLVNGLPEAVLSSIISAFGEERYARRVARAIVSRRAVRPFKSTADLADVIARVIPPQRGPSGAIHPATRTFQAIRIVVNGEIDALRAAIPAAIKITTPGGRVVVIAFHSIEDRTVKHVFGRAAGRCACPPGLPVCICGAVASVRILTPRPVIPTEAEFVTNPRSRSARLRAVEVLSPPHLDPNSTAWTDRYAAK